MPAPAFSQYPQMEGDRCDVACCLRRRWFSWLFYVRRYRKHHTGDEVCSKMEQVHAPSSPQNRMWSSHSASAYDKAVDCGPKPQRRLKSDFRADLAASAALMKIVSNGLPLRHRYHLHTSTRLKGWDSWPGGGLWPHGPPVWEAFVRRLGYEVLTMDLNVLVRLYCLRIAQYLYV